MKNDGNFEKKLNCVLENDMNFHRLKNSDFMLESKMADLNQNKNSKNQVDRMQCKKILTYCS